MANKEKRASYARGVDEHGKVYGCPPHQPMERYEVDGKIILEAPGHFSVRRRSRLAPFSVRKNG
jgi:hypothetical protein